MSEPDAESHASTFMYDIGLIDMVEDRENYREGGFHPVHLGDKFDNRYRVIHKLGAGGFSTVWLAQDETARCNVALKILSAEGSSKSPEENILCILQDDSCESPGKQFICPFQRSFRFDGPNGNHLCLVMKAAGPSVSALMMASGKAPGWFETSVARKMSLQVAQALAYIHSRGIGHGDFTSGNVLVEIDKFATLSEEEVYSRFGQPRMEKMYARSGAPLTPRAPKYVVEAMDLASLDRAFLSDRITIVDFGQAFFLNNPPQDGVGTSMAYLAPEAFFDLQASAASDCWALGCLLVDMRFGRSLFEQFLGPNEVVWQMVDMLGPLPENWWEKWEDKDKEMALEGGFSSLSKELEKIAEADKDEEDDDSKEKGDAVERQKSLTSGPIVTRNWTPGAVTVPEEEKESLCDLLAQVIKYKATGRISAEQVAAHGWFNLN